LFAQRSYHELGEVIHPEEWIDFDEEVLESHLMISMITSSGVPLRDASR